MSYTLVADRWPLTHIHADCNAGSAASLVPHSAAVFAVVPSSRLGPLNNKMSKSKGRIETQILPFPTLTNSRKNWFRIYHELGQQMMIKCTTVSAHLDPNQVTAKILHTRYLMIRAFHNTCSLPLWVCNVVANQNTQNLLTRCVFYALWLANALQTLEGTRLRITCIVHNIYM